MVEVIRIPALSDNYIWLMHDEASGESVVIDPAEAEPVLKAAADRGWTITQIWNTHWHGDHIGGNAAIKAVTGCTVTGPQGDADKIDTLDRQVGEGDTVAIGAHEAQVIDVPAHTAGHIAYFCPQLFDDGAGAAFVGDTLFAMGCGRLFEGTAEQMYRAMGKLKALPDDTIVYCAHEYTQANLKFALTVEPDNIALKNYNNHVNNLRNNNQTTVPTTIGIEKQINPFLRSAQPEIQTSAKQFDPNTQMNSLDAFTTIRRWKDQF